MDAEINRLLLTFEQLMRDTNREVINPEIHEISIEDLRPVAELVARSRAVYLKRLYEIAHAHKGAKSLPSDEEMGELGKLRGRFLDLVEGSKSVEIAIQRGYLDVKG